MLLFLRPETVKPHQLSRVRNDSDIHLEGVLLDGEGCPASLEGSNWSLNSCSSSQSSKSQEHPPSCFQVNTDSWEDCNGVQQLLCRQPNGSNTSLVHNLSNPQLSTNGLLNSSCIISASMINSTTVTATSSLINGDTNGHSFKAYSPSNASVQSTLLPEIAALLKEDSRVDSSLAATLKNGSLPGRTSPVAVPNRLHTHGQIRPESNSSASIGSWQLITGPGSLREAISTSDPGSHSRPSRLSLNTESDCIESSESSCTLVEDLTPCDRKPSLLLLESVIGLEGEAFSHELGLALEESFKVPNTLEIMSPESMTVSSSKGDDSVAVTATTTPTKEHDDIDEVDGNRESISNNNDETPEASRRRERLEKVRCRFSNLYDKTIGSSCRQDGNETSSSSGLGFFIGNFATKVGIRSSSHRVTNE